MSAIGDFALSRRAFLATGGALVVGFALRPHPVLAQDQSKPPAPDLPGSLNKTPLLDSWIRINADVSFRSA